MKEFAWKILAKVLSYEPIADYLIARAKRTPYYDLDGYMERDWLFNPYQAEYVEPPTTAKMRKFSWLPSFRIHHILRADTAKHPHDHPWNARTIILKNWYVEHRVVSVVSNPPWYDTKLRMAGDTATLDFGEFHHISEVHKDGVWTLFITFGYEGTWGFLVDGKKVHYKTYLANGGRA